MHELPTRVHSHFTVISYNPEISGSRSCDGIISSQICLVVLFIFFINWTLNTHVFTHSYACIHTFTHSRIHTFTPSRKYTSNSPTGRSTHLDCDGKFPLEVDRLLRFVVNAQACIPQVFAHIAIWGTGADGVGGRLVARATRAPDLQVQCG